MSAEQEQQQDTKVPEGGAASSPDASPLREDDSIRCLCESKLDNRGLVSLASARPC